MPAGLIAAGEADYLAGAWCGAAELYEEGLFAAGAYWEGDPDDHDAVLNGIGHLAWIHAAARVLAPSLVPQLAASAERTGAARYVEALRDDVPTWSVAEWERTADAQLLGRPFSDAGEERVIRV